MGWNHQPVNGWLFIVEHVHASVPTFSPSLTPPVQSPVSATNPLPHAEDRRGALKALKRSTQHVADVEEDLFFQVSYEKNVVV